MLCFISQICCLVCLQYNDSKTNNILEQRWLLNPLKQVFLHYIWLRLCNNGPSNMQCEAAEHWGDIKSDFVPLGVFLMAQEFWWTAWSSARQRDPERGEQRRENVIFLHHKLHCEKQPSMSCTSLSLSKIQSVFHCSVRTNTLNSESYWIDHMICSYPVS